MTLASDDTGKEAIYILQNSPQDIEKIEIIDVDPLMENDETIIAQVIQPLVNGDFEANVQTRQAVPSISDGIPCSMLSQRNVSFEISTDRYISKDIA
ncbi:hypothetical protein MGH68_16700 [Erysipelothrix sp. D19-032]